MWAGRSEVTPALPRSLRVARRTPLRLAATPAVPSSSASPSCKDLCRSDRAPRQAEARMRPRRLQQRRALEHRKRPTVPTPVLDANWVGRPDIDFWERRDRRFCVWQHGPGSVCLPSLWRRSLKKNDILHTDRKGHHKERNPSHRQKGRLERTKVFPQTESVTTKNTILHRRFIKQRAHEHTRTGNWSGGGLVERPRVTQTERVTIKNEILHTHTQG